MLKRVFFLVLATLAIGLPALAQSGQSGDKAMQFAHKRWDFGSIQEMGGNVSHKFTFKNISGKPVVIESVEVSCGCTTIDYSTKPVMPGNSGELTVVFDPQGRPGPFNKAIIVKANNATLTSTLSVEGSVVEREHTVEELYPVALSSGVRITGRAAFFRYLPQGEANSMTIGWTNTSSKPVKLSAVIDPASPYLKVNAPATLPAGGRGDITVTYDLTGQKSAYGVFIGNIYLVVNGAKDKLPIAATGYGVDKFDGQGDEKSPRARFDVQYNDFGDVQASAKPVSQQFTLTNTGGSPLIVRNVTIGRGLSTTLKGGITIQPSKSVTFTVSMNPERMSKGVVSESVIIIMNDPLRPMRELRLAATIR